MSAEIQKMIIKKRGMGKNIKNGMFKKAQATPNSQDSRTQATPNSQQGKEKRSILSQYTPLSQRIIVQGARNDINTFMKDHHDSISALSTMRHKKYNSTDAK